MDQTNPLAELTHKRRLSALGPGGLTRDRAGFEVRDVHYTHYGRMCPIETPEGPNIGLISLAGHVRPHQRVRLPRDAVPQGRERPRRRRRSMFLSADEEDRCIIAQANAPMDEKGHFLDEPCSRATAASSRWCRPSELDYMDVSPMQLVSPAASLIPFLEHDDANRALMGSNMQRQAVPLLADRGAARRHRPGGQGRAGLRRARRRAARRHGRQRLGRARSSSIRVADKETARRLLRRTRAWTNYRCTKFRRSNQDTCINQQPLVARRASGSRRAQSSPTARRRTTGELALGMQRAGRVHAVGRLQLRGRHPGQRALLKDDMFTSLHIEEFELPGPRHQARRRGDHARDPERRRGSAEEPRRGRHHPHRRPRAAGDILVGKVTPKGETELSPEERLLRAIFGEKAGDVRDASLKAPPGMDGIVVDIKVFSPRGARRQAPKKDKKQSIVEAQRNSATATSSASSTCGARSCRAPDDRRDEREARRTPRPARCSPRRDARSPTSSSRRSTWTTLHWGLPIVKDARSTRQVQIVLEAAAAAIERIDVEYEKEVEHVTRGDELPPGVVEAGQGLRGQEAQAVGRRQDGRPPRQQGRGGQDPRRGGHAVPAGRHRRSTSC